MEWFRVYHSLPTDPKLRVVARRAGQPVSSVLSVFVMMLVDASTSPKRGNMHRWDDEEASITLDIQVDHVASIREAMQGKLLDGLRVIDWEKLQPKREDGSAERGKEYREKLKEKAAAGAAGEGTAPTAPDHKRTELTGNERIRTQPNAGERNRPLEESREEKIEDDVEERAPTEATAAGTELELLTPEKIVATSFDRWRLEGWPHESGFSAPSMTIEHQARQYLDQGAPLALLLEIIEREMRDAAASGKSATHSLAAFKHVLPKALKAHQQKVIFDVQPNDSGRVGGRTHDPIVPHGPILGPVARAALAERMERERTGASIEH